MKIQLNNREEIINGDIMTIDQLLKEKKFSFSRLIIKINGKLIKQSEYSTVTFQDGDTVDVIHLISGG